MFVMAVAIAVNEAITMSLQSTVRQFIAALTAMAKLATLRFSSTINGQLSICLMSVELSTTIINSHHSLKNGKVEYCLGLCE